IALLARKTDRADAPRVLFNDKANASSAADRRAQLLLSIESPDSESTYIPALPSAANRFSLRPSAVGAAYAAWPKLPTLAAIAPLNGPMEKRGGALIDNDRVALERRMRAYFDPDREWKDVRGTIGGLGQNAARFPAQETRAKAVRMGTFLEGRIQRYLVRPFDLRWAYVTPDRPIWNEPRPELLRTLTIAGGFVATRPAGVAKPEGVPLTWTLLLGDNDALRGHAYYTPLCCRCDGGSAANLSPAARVWLADLGLPDPDSDRAIAALPWHHALAIGYAPAWLAENEAGIRQDWPRVPLPDTAALLRASAALGARVAALLDPETPVPGVTAGTILPALAPIAVPTRQGGGAMRPEDYALTAGWGHAGKGGAVMPGRGRIVIRPYAADEAATAAEATLLGARTHDVFLNATACWRNVPETVWDFTIGGYQVLKKYLSYRERPLLGRTLTPAELRHVRDTARRLAALCLMAPELDANYRAAASAHYRLPDVG
ncbi:MAG: type ISP restriction/modification enzyme, partial [Acetobacteraceae bacterium]